MEGFESFRPSSENKGANDEFKELKKLKIHSKDNLHDEEGSAGINEATGKREKTSEVDGADEKLSEKSSELRLQKLPDDAGQLARWLEKEKARLEKQKDAKRKKAA